MKTSSVVICAVVSLALIAVAGMAGVIILSLQEKKIPEGLPLVVATCVSAVAGISPGMVSSRPLAGNDPPAEPLATPVQTTGAVQ